MSQVPRTSTAWPGMRNLLTSSPGDIAMGTSQGEGHLFGATLGTACRGSKEMAEKRNPLSTEHF